MMEKIISVNELKTEEVTEYFILLNGGLRSSKNISFNDDVFTVHNEIDDTFQKLTEAELLTDSNIGDAIALGAFYKY